MMKMRTIVSHVAPDGSDYKPGLRDYFTYRDTGVSEITGGAFTAHLIRAVPGKTVKPEWHTHTVGFQIFFVFKGWVEFEYEDIGRVRMGPGDLVYQPSGVKHRELCHSDDFEVLEIVSPANFATELVPAGEEPASDFD